MSLKTDVEALRDATLAALSAAHDHFIYTKKIWRIIDIEIRRRHRRILLRNEVTGTRMSSEADLLPLAQKAANDYLPSATVQQFASLAESFLTDLVRLWLTAYPKHLKGQVEVQSILGAPSVAAIVQQVIDQYVSSMTYKRPAEWFKHLNEIVFLNCPAPTEVEQFTEFKATRDVFVHNRGIVSEVYVLKAGARARGAVGQPLELPDPHLHDSYRLCRKLVTDVAVPRLPKPDGANERMGRIAACYEDAS